MPQIEFKSLTLKPLSANKTTWFTVPHIKPRRDKDTLREAAGAEPHGARL